MARVTINEAKIVQQNYAFGIAAEFEFEYLKAEEGFLKDSVFTASIRIIFSGYTIKRWGIHDQRDNNVIKHAFPYVIETIKDRVKDGTLKEFEEIIISVDNSGPSYPFDISKIDKVKGYELEFESQVEIISTRIEHNTKANEIITLRDNINVLIHSKIKDTLFKLNQERSILCLFRNVTTEEELVYATASLANLVADLNVQLLKKLVLDPQKGDKSIALLEKFLNSIQPDNQELIGIMKHIIWLRQAFPIHTDKANIVKALKEFGIEYGDKEYGRIWTILVTKYRDSLNLMLVVIKKYCT